MNVIEALRHHVRMRPYDLALVHPGGSLNFLQLAGTVASAAGKLRSQGIGPGKTAAIYVNDPHVHLVVALACMLNGTVTISAHPNYDPIPPGAKIDAYVVDRAVSHAAQVPSVHVNPAWLGDLAPDAQGSLAGPGFPDEQAVCRMYTSSGTTGVAKVIGHTTAMVESIITRSVMLEPLNHGPNLSMMWYSTIGGFTTALGTLWHGCTLVTATAPLVVLRYINLYKVKFLRVSPQQLQGLVDLVRGRPVRFPSLERIEAGGASTPQPVVLAARAILCPNVVGIYGSTEAGMVAQTPAALMYAQSDAAGYVTPKVTVRIVDDAGQAVPPGTEGHIQIRTPDMADRYIGDPEASAAAFRDGWFIPGDLGSLSADGLLRITGRADEMINAGGVKLSPVLVDEFLMTQPGVRDAATFAYRQPGRADQVWAAVVCGDAFDEQAVLAAARARLNSRAPVRIFRLDEIPRNAMGKPMRHQLAQDAKAT
ncbi:MAG: long-chain fatty acid--CoA ligase [Burkholderiales bacterium]|nr:long-chain fatty acid--CoA ligase [Burkholderiales bacterium]